MDDPLETSDPQFEYYYQEYQETSDDGEPFYYIEDDMAEYYTIDSTANSKYPDEGFSFDQLIFEAPEGVEALQLEDNEPSTSHIDEVINEVAHYDTEMPGNKDGVKRKGVTTKTCEFCGILLKYPSKIAAHMRTHTKEKPFICTYCNKRFSQKTPWNSHMKRHSGDTPYSCNFCSKAFTYASVCKAHELRVHLKKEKSLNKKGNSEMDDPQKTLQTHDIGTTVIENTDKGKEICTYSCQICGLNLKYPSKIEAHMRTHHHGQKSYACPKCNSTFASEATLNIHTNRYHTNLRPYPCRWKCGKTFLLSSNRSEHEKIVHSKIKRYLCGIANCNRLFTRRAYISKHLSRDHSELGSIPSSDKGFRVVAIPYDPETASKIIHSENTKLINNGDITYFVDILGPMNGQPMSDPVYVEDVYLNYDDSEDISCAEEPPHLERADVPLDTQPNFEENF